jgi:HEAT repeat protein
MQTQVTGIVYWAIGILLAVNVSIVLLTVGVKAARTIRAGWYKRHFRRIEPAVENYILTGEDQLELEALRPWQQDVFVSRLIVERMALVRGSGKDHLKRLAEHLGLVDRYLEYLGSRRRWRRARAAENLGYFGGERSVRPLGRLLADSDETVRAVAARALARIGTPETAEILAKTLNDPSELTRLRMAENLERVGTLAIEPLVEIFKNGKPQAQILAARVLGNLRAAETRSVLREAMLGGSFTDLRAQATLALGKIGDPEDIPALLEASADESWPVRAQVANALGMIGELSTIPTLQRLTVDKEWWVRMNASRALAKMGPAGERALAQLLGSEDHFARDRAAAALEERGITRRVARELTEPDERGETARAMIQTMVRAGAVRYLERLARTLPDERTRAALRQTMAEARES